MWIRAPKYDPTMAQIIEDSREAQWFLVDVHTAYQATLGFMVALYRSTRGHTRLPRAQRLYAAQQIRLEPDPSDRLYSSRNKKKRTAACGVPLYWVFLACFLACLLARAFRIRWTLVQLSLVR